MNASCYQYGIDCPLPLTGSDTRVVVFIALLLLFFGACSWWASRGYKAPDD